MGERKIKELKQNCTSISGLCGSLSGPEPFENIIKVRVVTRRVPARAHSSID